jgi:tetratricopeptide (TPR) repeat protein
MKSRVWVVFLLLAGSVAAQLGAGTIIHRVRVRISFTDGVCDRSTNVRMMGVSGPMQEGIANDQCFVDFMNVPAGTYHLIVSGQNFSSVDAGNIAMDSTGSQEYEVKVKRNNEAEHAAGGLGSQLISAADLAVPVKAQKEFDKANELVAKQDLTQAIQRLNRAIEVYPAYAGAYNNLAVIYSRQGDHVRELEALQKAIRINDHFAPAYVNLGRMNITAKDFPGAEAALTKASSFDPTDAMTFVLLAYAEFMDHHIDQAIVSSRKAHSLQGVHAYAHQIAARAYEQKRDGAGAITELEQFLKEETTGARAEGARKELAALHAIQTNSVSTAKAQ